METAKCCIYTISGFGEFKINGNEEAYAEFSQVEMLLMEKLSIKTHSSPV